MPQSPTVDGTDVQRWNLTVERIQDGAFSMDPLLAAQYQRVHLALCRAWAPETGNPLVRKTDVFAEATCPERAFSWSIGKSERLVSMDISSTLLHAAKYNENMLRSSTSSYTVGDARTLPFADDTFDVIVSDSTLDHFSEAGDITRSIRELARVLRPGGVLIITMDNPTNLTEPLFRTWIAMGKNPYFIGKTLTARGLAQALQDAGLTVTATTAIIHNSRYFAKAGVRLLRRLRLPGHENLIRHLLKASESLDRSPTRLLTAQFIAARGVKMNGATE
ncbi:MAG: methyltransferase domain-containing protein [Dehalococcoidia bacterium]|nr:methyltransferase domain-containing protein [Dehalococcoidia bacterium]